jgi:hypothetical protein
MFDQTTIWRKNGLETAHTVNTVIEIRNTMESRRLEPVAQSSFLKRQQSSAFRILGLVAISRLG